MQKVNSFYFSIIFFQQTTTPKMLERKKRDGSQQLTRNLFRFVQQNGMIARTK